MDKFENVKVGDRVIVHEKFGRLSVGEVTKVNKVSFVVENSRTKSTYNKIDGYSRGGDIWTHTFVEHATEEKIKAVEEEDRRQNYIFFLKNRVNWSDLPTESLEKICMCVRNLNLEVK